MAAISELDALLKDLETSADTTLKAVAAIREMFSSPMGESGFVEIYDPKEDAQKPVTIEEVRAVLSGLSRAGRTAEVKALLKQHGADKLSGIDPTEYGALIKEAGELNA